MAGFAQNGINGKLATYDGTAASKKSGPTGVKYMIYKVISARYVRDYIIYLKFNDGLEGDVNLKEELEGDVFSPLKDLILFKKFKVHPELHTLVWDNDADFAPEFLHEIVQIPA
jgi:hypothetical protein